ncbi:MAG: Holliday junction branch migration protein RuvA [Fimbriiglobus sp.]
MITKMTGTLNRVIDDECRVQIGPLEYQVLVPEAVRRQVQMRLGSEITFHTTEYLDGTPNGNRFVPRRIGFLTEQELDFFELFCTVEKIGVKKALKAMARSVQDIAGAINRQDSRWLSTLPGIGATTAEVIVTSLKRKVAPFLVAAPSSQFAGDPPTAVVVDAAAGSAPEPKSRKKSAPAAIEPPPANLPAGRLVEDVYEAMMALGMNPIEARAKLDSLLTAGKPFGSVEEALMMVFSRG